ncbi:pyruvate dehydrogenase (acetyl-transferring) E1 component subunit alpha [uncultured Thiohalocapsa sp.]|uniref:pyruvate dehydrogenase (acetyl-transferring) E1 component subunit alpha n=1 Tax=uncultured Thiohalocapsa sp. TaxID=768990 RepID=UPI0025E1068F|nr:pyruvate dehydrogenase (acetyl-transferring) E1 component subunit alpha [uncultured Thiohalocapsa sp.]
MTDAHPPDNTPQAHKLHLSRTHALHLLREMLRIRAFEERCAELYTAEKIRGFLHLYSGEEAIAVGIMQGLAPTDAVVATYREHGHALARGLPMDRLMAEMYGKETGVSRGRGGSMHLFDAERRFYGGSAIVGAGIPLAVGLALADRMQARTQVTACFFGEGAVAEGAFHESLNLAALWQLPVLFVCENNRYAMGTALERSESETDIARKAAGYQMPAVALDGMDVIAVEAAAREAIAEIRNGGGPRFLECRTYRFRAHSMFDPQLYRDKAEVAQWKQQGPIVRFRRWLEAAGMLDADTAGQLDAEIAQALAAAVDFAEGSDWEPVADLTRDVAG